MRKTKTFFKPRDLEVVEIPDCFADRETDAAMLVLLANDEEIWIPKSHVDDASEVYKAGHNGTLVITKWIAEQKGLLEKRKAAALKVKLKYVGP